MKRKEFTGELSYYERLNCSCYGNPRYYGVFTNERGETLAGKTAMDAACAYGFLNYRNAPPESNVSHYPKRQYYF